MVVGCMGGMHVACLVGFENFGRIGGCNYWNYGDVGYIGVWGGSNYHMNCFGSRVGVGKLVCS